MLLRMWACWKAARRLRGYHPQRVTFQSVYKWLRQFPQSDHHALIHLLKRVIYFSEHDTRTALVELNRRLLERLAAQGIPVNKVVYVQVGEAGSSSPLMLNMLRDAALLEGRGCKFCDSKDVRGLRDITDKMEEGAIIYIDDFGGTGDQFTKSRGWVAQFILGKFAEFFLLPCICSEAEHKLCLLGIETVYKHLHTTDERPLHDDCSLFSPKTKERIRELCGEIVDRPGGGLGYHNMATMVVFYRNATNHLPSVLRGNRAQDRYKGVLPRTTDLPIKP